MSTDSLVVLRYRNEGKSGRSRGHLKEIMNGVDAVRKPVELSVDSVAVLPSWDGLRSLLVEEGLRIGRPMRVFIDMSSMPRYLSLGVLGYGFRSGLVDSIDFYYAEASSYDTASDTAPVFTEGRWHPWPIVGLGGLSPARARTHLVVSAGFEGKQTKKLVDTIEPDRISIMFAEPGASPVAEGRSRDENESLVRTYLVPDSNILSAPLNTQHAAELLELMLSSKSESATPFPEVTSFLLAGPKPHSLAAAAVAIKRGRGDVLYVRPDEHRETDVDSWGTCWLTTISRPWAQA